MTQENLSSKVSSPDPNDWDHHWDSYGDAAEGNPANVYRRELILKLMGNPLPGTTVLDIGSGQGEFALELGSRFPELSVWGAEYSAAGVERARAAATHEGSTARFQQMDLLKPVQLADGQAPATVAICSEVLEHVDDPTTLLRNSLALLAPGCRLVVTVPGGPRSAFDRHIGHYQHFSASLLRKVLTDAGYRVDRVLRAGFPFFNIYKMAVIIRGRRLIADVERRTAESPTIRGESLMKSFFGFGFRHSLDSSAFGWQMAAVATVPQDEQGQ